MHKKIMIGIFAFILVALPILTFVFMPAGERPFSEIENKSLAAMPTLSIDNIYKDDKSKNFMSLYEKWFSDRFFGRIQWIEAKNKMEKLLGKINVNGVFTYDDRMMQVWDSYDPAITDRNLGAMNKLAEKNPDVPVYAIIAPTSQEIYSYLLPAVTPIESQKDYVSYCYEKLPNVTCIDIIPELEKHSDEYIYYRTDHHWTSYGAYLAYSTAAAKLGYTAVPMSSFSIEHASSDFRGTLFSKTIDYGVTPDVIDYYHNTSIDNKIKLTIDTGEEITEYDTLYFRDFLNVKDKYSSFLGSNSPLMEIETSVDNGKSILIFKDSYAHCFIPFLTNNYSKITVLDMRYINIDYRQLADPNDYDQVLFLFNAITFSESTDVSKLNLAK